MWSGRRLWGVTRASLAVGVALWSFGVAAKPTALREPARLMDALESTPALMVGAVTQVESLDHGGWIATIDIERMVRGKVESDGEAILPEIEVAWEEPVPVMDARLEVGRRMLLAIDSMSTASIWKQRVPDAERRLRLYQIAEKSAAYVERPSAAELLDLEHYLNLTSEAKRGEAGVNYLAALAARAQPVLAIAALAKLDTISSLSRYLEGVPANQLIDAVMRSGRNMNDARGTAEDDVSQATIALLGSRKPRPVRSAIEARIHAEGPGAPAILYAALGAITGEIPDDVAMELLASASVEHRLAAARFAKGERGREQIRYLLRWDPDPGVRAASVKRLLQLEEGDGLADAIRSLEDPATEVRLAAMKSIAGLDPEAIRELEYVVDSGSTEGARNAVVTLSMMGEEARQLLFKISEQHPDESVRALAGIAVGKGIGHHD